LFVSFEDNVATDLELADVDYLSETFMPLMFKMMEEALMDKPTKDVLGAHLALWLAQTEKAPPSVWQALQE